MAAAVIPDIGMLGFLKNALPDGLYVRLFSNDVPVVSGSVLSDFSPALFPGYADVLLDGLWSAPQMDPLGRAYSRIPNVSWTRGAGGVLEIEYGWILYQYPTPSSVIRGGQRFDAPISVSIPGQIIMVSIIAFLLRG